MANKTETPMVPLLQVKYQHIGKLRADPANARKHSKGQIKQVARSIREFGFRVPLLVTGDNQVVAGHARLEACKVLHIERVPTIVIDNLSQVQLRAFMIADNKLSEAATWDRQMLAEQFTILTELDPTFDVDTTGFAIAEIDLMIEGLQQKLEHGSDSADSLPPAEPTVVSQAGDLWLLDRHRILCGDALAPESYSVLLDGKRAAAIITDPPYNLRVDGYVAGFGKTHYREFAVGSGEMTRGEFERFLSTVITHLINNSQDGSLHYIFLDWRHCKELLQAAEQYTEHKAICVWVKESGGQGSLYRSRHEFVFLFKSGNGPHCNNVELGCHGRYRTNIWEYRRANRRPEDDECGCSELHPTIKPVSLVADAILDCTRRGDLVLDPFLGSGTTILACERTGRVGCGIELDPRYIDLIIRRWERFTGSSALHAQSGKSFSELQEVRCGQ